MITDDTIKYLKEVGKTVCVENECTEYDHNCETYAYFDDHYNLLDVCCSDYFQGSSRPTAAVLVSKDFDMTADELMNEIADQTFIV